MSKHLEMKALIEELNQASDAYYNGGHTIMTDAEWDQKYESLKNWNLKPELCFLILLHIALAMRSVTL